MANIEKIVAALSGVACAVPGAIKGYCDAKGIPVSSDALKYGMLAAPAVLQGLFFGGYTKFADSQTMNGTYHPKRALAFGLFGGALETGIGYCLGYTIGKQI